MQAVKLFHTSFIFIHLIEHCFISRAVSIVKQYNGYWHSFCEITFVITPSAGVGYGVLQNTPRLASFTPLLINVTLHTIII